MGRIILDKNKRAQIRREFYDKADMGGMTPQEAIKTLRKIAGLTQAQFAELLQVSAEALKEIERGKGNPTLKTLNRLLKFGGLQVTVGRKKRV
jgi:DNA-binding XRE family transcriptional regulator